MVRSVNARPSSSCPAKSSQALRRLRKLVCDAGHPRLMTSKTWMAGHRRAEATPSFGRLCPAMTANFEKLCLFRRLFRRRAREHRFGMPDMLVTLAFGDVVIAAGVIGHGAVVVAVCGTVGAGEILHRISEIGVGVAQAFGGAGVAK